MIELAPNVHYLPGKNKSRFPYCACLYLAGKEMKVLIDAGMGGGNLRPAKDLGIDLLILTHCHVDHRLTRREIPHVPVWCHELEESFLCDKDHFLAATGLSRSGIDLRPFYGGLNDAFDMEVAHRLVDGERLDLGGLTLVTMHTPGHTPGHLAFYIPEHGLLFSADVDLTSFGPYYGHDFADIDAFIRSIDKLKQIGAKTVTTGHAGPFNGDAGERLEAYKAIIHERDRRVLNHLVEPRRMVDLVGRNLIYAAYTEGDLLQSWFERVHLEKHLTRLARMGQVCRDTDSGAWCRC
jgi:glyoxylase-like metal-dependent hydrolase (beta-lactamase superfamily II)